MKARLSSLITDLIDKDTQTSTKRDNSNRNQNLDKLVVSNIEGSTEIEANGSTYIVTNKYVINNNKNTTSSSK